MSQPLIQAIAPPSEVDPARVEHLARLLKMDRCSREHLQAGMRCCCALTLREQARLRVSARG